MPRNKPTFVSVAETLIKDTEVDVRAKVRPASAVRDYKQRLTCYCRPFFKETLIERVDYRMLREFNAWLVDERELSRSTILTIMSFVSSVLTLAAKEQYIQAAPPIPRPKQKDTPRPSFTRMEYKQLLVQLRRVEKMKPVVKVRAWPITSELRAFVTFMVNSFLRPGDALGLKHKHIEVKEAPSGLPYLRITPPVSKTRHDSVVTMPAAVAIYARLKDKWAKEGLAGPDDYVFLPNRSSRSFAMEILRRQFQHVLRECGLAITPFGEERTLYSLRHTAIMLRLLNGSGLDVVTLAHNCRTSVEMIDRFYARPLKGEMNIDLVHSMRRPSRLVSSL